MLDAQGREGNAGSLASLGLGEVQADGVVASAGDGGILRLNGVLGAVQPVLLGPGSVSIHDVGGVDAVLEEGEIDLQGRDGGKVFLVDHDPVGVAQVAVEGTGVGGQLIDPLVEDVHAGHDAVVRRGVALLDLDGSAVDADLVDADLPAREDVLAISDAQRGEGQACRGGLEGKADGVVALAGDGGLGHGHARGGLAGVPHLVGAPGRVGEHQEGLRGRRRFLCHGGHDAQHHAQRKQHGQKLGHVLHLGFLLTMLKTLAGGCIKACPGIIFRSK